jgi:hypothetical protein
MAMHGVFAFQPKFGQMLTSMEAFPRKFADATQPVDESLGTLARFLGDARSSAQGRVVSSRLGFASRG